MARAVALIPDLLFGSNVIGALKAAGHDPVLVANATDLERAVGGADVLIVDLTADPAERIELVRPLLDSGAPGRTLRTLAFFSHVERDVRTEAEEAGFDLVVPRSRMARAGGELVSQLADSAR